MQTLAGVDTSICEDGSTRGRILAAAEKLFSELGFDGVSLRKIAMDAGVPVGLVSYHFDGKSGVYRAIFESRSPALVEQRRAGLALAALEEDPDRRLELVLKGVLVPMLKLRSVPGSTHFGTLLAREVSDPRAFERRIVQEIFDPVALAVIAQLERAMTERSKAEIHWAYQTMIGTMIYVMADAGRIARLSGGAADPEDTEATVRHLISILLSGLRSRGGKSATENVRFGEERQGNSSTTPCLLLY
jgi:AcrR family transcriptional regulator